VFVSVSWLFLNLVHTLAFGSMFYSLNVLQPKTRAYFIGDRQYEDFMAGLAQGARTKMFAAFALMGASGAVMAVLHWRDSWLWLTLLGVKVALFLAALGVFCVVTFRYWPLRVFATDDELPMHHARFKRVGWTMQTLIGLNMAMGIIAHAV